MFVNDFTGQRERGRRKIVRYEQAILHRVRALNSARRWKNVKPSSSPELHKVPVGGLTQLSSVEPSRVFVDFVLAASGKAGEFDGFLRVKKKN